MKIKLHLTCTCQAPNFIEIEDEQVMEKSSWIATCRDCNRTIMINVNKLDKNNKIIDYNVQIRE
ncbi:hypothetical protein FBR05_02090 [Deltaproteobacteria bacterium PRO3]|nr:hypothetical protein [Deltaproteobacteria bacterium PRO3]